MSDPLQGWLDIRPALKDNSFGSNDKWNALAKARDVKKLNTLIHIPAFSLQYNNLNGASFIVAQYNYIASQPFTLIDFPFSFIHDNPPEVLCFIAIRYRVGTTAFRRILYNQEGFINLDCPFYGGEIIKQNFVIEFWSKGFQSNNPETIELLSDLYLRTSILSVPNSAYDISPSVESLTGLFTDLFTPLPQNMPMPDVNSNGPWLTN